MTNNTDPTKDNYSFVAAEHRVLDLWKTEDTFQASLAQTADAAPYVFYDGPPFATGLPHHGHLVGSILKDVVPRYFTMKGYYVQRRFGWDCHGLPIEYEIDKALGMSSQEAVEKMGIKGYNDECRAIVQRYTSEWEKTISRIGRWVDFENDYKTMDPSYMESVWWVVKQLWEKDLVYRGNKVVPFSTALGTILSNFEAGSNYQDVQDPAVTVMFKLQDEDAYVAAWTTTPWTLPSNLALCVGADIDYVKVRDSELGRDIYLAKARVEDVTKGRDIEILEELKGSAMVGRTYEPLFNYFEACRADGAFQIVADDYVSTDSGTGVVHQAPAFGEDDFRVLKHAGISAIVCPVDMAGKFTEEVTDFAGLHVKEADKPIIRQLKEQGSLYRQDVLLHSYPFCPRSNTPIIYRTIDSWYIKVESMREKLQAANQQINWVPEHIQNGRMGKWLDNSIDWAFSRNRYWGTPIPIWINDVTGDRKCIGSIDELYELSGVRVEDLHREVVDDLTFSVEGEAGVYRRIEEVLDCWFESGAMPYAQLHYPFENQEMFDKGFPAEYIAEGLDQTRGWFYTLIVLGSALFDTHPFKNVIVNGIVMAEDGKKMSKSLRNYTPPDNLMEEYGADALRLYLINSGLVRGEEQRFANDGVKDMVRRVLLPWLNAFKFFNTYAEIDQWRPTEKPVASDNIMDQWVLSRLQSLKANIATEMESYRLYNVVPELFEFIEELTNWYIRLNRPRFWAEGESTDKSAAYQTLFTVLHELALVMAPFTPFLSESIYRSLKRYLPETEAESVHLCAYPVATEQLIQPMLEQAVTRMQHIILLGRQKRNQEKVKTKFPLAELTVIHKDPALLEEISRLESYLASELNVKAVTYNEDEAAYINLYAKPNSPVLGKRLGKRFKDFKQQIENLTAEQVNEFQNSGALELSGEAFSAEDILIFREAREGTDALSDKFVSIELVCELTEPLIKEGLAREVVNRIQKTRKDQQFKVSDRINVIISADTTLTEAIQAHESHVKGETLADSLTFSADPAGVEMAIEYDIDGATLGLTITRA
ncbi:MAG: isoleucyl-tRNA synthetase [Candidatus Azotimanducaceae bacterium]|jgi:isoleucyl-tRNA synthetase